MKRKLLCILIANLFAAATAVCAQDLKVTGSVSAGGIYVDDNDVRDGSKMNEYQDLSSGGLVGFDVKGRSSRYWFDAFGENLARDDQYIAIRGGSYDVFKYKLWTDSLKHNFLWDGITPYAGAGSAVQTATFPRLDPLTWNQIDVGYRRRDDGGYFELQSVTPWYARVDANQITWKGSKPGSASQGTSPGNGFVDLAFPVDYNTRNLVIEGGYNTRAMRFDLSYMLSKFENSTESISWTNGYLGATDKTHLAADNRYTRVMGNATFRDLPGHTTLAARFTTDELKDSVGLDSSVLTGTGGVSTPTAPSAGSFDGKVKNTTFTLTAASVLTKGLDTKVYYNYRKRDEESPEVTFTSPYFGTHVAEPFSYEKNNWGFDAYFRLDRGNRFGLGYDYLDTKREGRDDFDRTKDKRLFLEYKNSMLDDFSGRLKYTRLERDSNFLLANSGTGTTDPNYENRYVTAFDLSNVDQDQLKLTLDWTPAANFDVGFEGIAKKNKYKENVLGRLKDERSEIYVSASYGEPGGPRFTVFGDAERVKYDSTHRIIGAGSTSGAYEPSAPPNASNYNWSGTITDKNWAAGIAFDWPATEKLSIKASAIFYKTDGYVDLALQEGVPTSVVRPVPIAAWDDSKRTSFNVKGVYAINKAWSFTGGYAFEKYEYSDSQYDGYRNTVPASSKQDSYLSGVYANPQYKANIVYGLVTYRF
jgi:hypothetical protein